MAFYFSNSSMFPYYATCLQWFFFFSPTPCSFSFVAAFTFLCFYKKISLYFISSNNFLTCLVFIRFYTNIGNWKYIIFMISKKGWVSRVTFFTVFSKNYVKPHWTPGTLHHYGHQNHRKNQVTCCTIDVRSASSPKPRFRVTQGI